MKEREKKKEKERNIYHMMPIKRKTMVTSGIENQRVCIIARVPANRFKIRKGRRARNAYFFCYFIMFF